MRDNIQLELKLGGNNLPRKESVVNESRKVRKALLRNIVNRTAGSRETLYSDNISLQNTCKVDVAPVKGQTECYVFQSLDGDVTDDGNRGYLRRPVSRPWQTWPCFCVFCTRDHAKETTRRDCMVTNHCHIHGAKSIFATTGCAVLCNFSRTSHLYLHL